METAVHCASRLMYQAKEHKNTVIVASSSAVLSAPATLLPKQSRQQILIADDSAMNRMLLAEILGTDFRILEASNGEECLEQLRHNPGDVALVLLDINMPVLDGFDVLSAMNRDHSIEDIPVIMISSDDSKDIIRRAFERGVSDYINRPFDAGRSTAGLSIPSGSTPSSGVWYGWCRPRPASRSTTPPCWSMC